MTTPNQGPLKVVYRGDLPRGRVGIRFNKVTGVVELHAHHSKQSQVEEALKQIQEEERKGDDAQTENGGNDSGNSAAL